MLTQAQKRRIEKLFEPAYQSTTQSVAITIKHYLGVTQDEDGHNVDSYQDISLRALSGRGGKFSTEEGEVRTSAGRLRFVIRETDLPDGVVGADITKNDKIVYGGDTLDITELRYIEGLAVWIAVEGG